MFKRKRQDPTAPRYRHNAAQTRAFADAINLLLEIQWRLEAEADAAARAELQASADAQYDEVARAWAVWLGVD